MAGNEPILNLTNETQRIISKNLTVTAFATPSEFLGGTTAPASVSVSSWMELATMYEVLTEENKIATKSFFLAMRSFFVNGGSHCYLLKMDVSMLAELAQLDDVTLFVQAG
ncbi:hypothetical protein ACU63Y_24445 [Klebsiella aerogenes]